MSYLVIVGVLRDRSGEIKLRINSRNLLKSISPLNSAYIDNNYLCVNTTNGKPIVTAKPSVMLDNGQERDFSFWWELEPDRKLWSQKAEFYKGQQTLVGLWYGVPQKQIPPASLRAANDEIIKLLKQTKLLKGL